MRLDLNCDLGEGEPAARTRALMRWITSANIACGGHAGTVRSMDACLRWAKAAGVRAGAHPGMAGGFGRDERPIGAEALELLLLQQVGALMRIAADLGVRLHHIKLHGALYHQVDRDAHLARAYLDVVRRRFPGLRVYARAGGGVVGQARRAGVRVWEEAFADRAYRETGELVPRGEPGAVLEGVRPMQERLGGLRDGHGVLANTGAWVPLTVRTVCVHSDTPDSVRIARLAAGILGLARR